jgi:hypothetical protein
MTDKWDEIARKIVDIEWELSPAVLCPAIAAALRDAEKAGADKVESERARWERLATMAWGLADEYGNQLFRDRYAAIRAAKETKK